MYPPLSEAEAKRVWSGGFKATEIEKAKYVAQVFTRHTGLGLESFFCEMYFPYFALLDLSLLRRTFDADPIGPLQPQAAYYVTRNLATMLDGLEPAQFACAVDPAPKNLETFTLPRPTDRPWRLAGRPGHATGCAGVPVDVRLTIPCRKAVGFDPLNGVSQRCSLSHKPATVPSSRRYSSAIGRSSFASLTGKVELSRKYRVPEGSWHRCTQRRSQRQSCPDLPSRTTSIGRTRRWEARHPTKATSQSGWRIETLVSSLVPSGLGQRPEAAPNNPGKAVSVPP